MSHFRAFRCWIKDAEDLGAGIVGATSADKARYGVALSAAEVGYIPNPSPCFIRCVRAPEYDSHPSILDGAFKGEDCFKPIASLNP